MAAILVALDKILTKGALQEYRGPLFFSNFKQILIMIAVCEGLIALCEWFNTCLLQFKQDFRWLSVSQPNRFIIAYDAESVEQKSINLGLN